MHVQFQNTAYLVGLVAVPLLAILFWWVIVWKRKVRSRIGDTRLVNELTRSYSPTSFYIKFGLSVLAFASLIVALANLQKLGETDQVQRKGVDVMIAMDVSKSMLATDLQPNRLEIAKQFANKLIDQLQNDRLGFILFAGRAYLQMPLTTDHGAAKMFIQNASPDAVPTQGTAIAEALRLGASSFNAKDNKFKSIVLITDGEDHDPSSIAVSQELAARAVMINTVGVGTPQGSELKDASGTPKFDATGNVIISKLNEDQLQKLASATQGVYVRLSEIESAVHEVMQQIGKIEKTSLEDSAYSNFNSYFQWFLALALVFLITEMLLPERKMKIE